MEILLLLVLLVALVVAIWYWLKLLYIILKALSLLMYKGILWFCRITRPKPAQQLQEPIYAKAIEPTPQLALSEHSEPFAAPQPPLPAPEPIRYGLEELIQWEHEEELWHCVFRPPIDSDVEYLRCSVKDYFCPNTLVESGELNDIDIIGTDRYNFTSSTFLGKHINIPYRGILESEFKGDFFASYRIFPDGRIITVNTNAEAIAEYIAQQEREAEERKRIALENEKEEIAAKIKEKHRRRQLEKLVRQELIDSGELFGEQSKRPHIPREVVDAVYIRDGGCCVYCGSTENLHLDHIIPFSRGGATNVENLQLLCQKCNLEKSNKIG